jgi:enoyl-CoA hydratase
MTTTETGFSTSYSTLRVVDLEHCVHVELARPHKKNAIDATMVADLHRVCARLEADPGTLVISGSDGVFAAGADLAQMRERRSSDALAGINSSLFQRIQHLPMPVIAAVDGWALGGGAELAYAADFRIAAAGARFGNPEASLGIAAAAGGSWRLRELVGEPIAKQMLLAGRVLDAHEALASGLVTDVVAPDQLLAGAFRLAAQIAKGSPNAVRLTKALMHAPADAHPVIDNIAQAVLFESDEKYQRMTAFLERRRERDS